MVNFEQDRNPLLNTSTSQAYVTTVARLSYRGHSCGRIGFDSERYKNQSIPTDGEHLVDRDPSVLPTRPGVKHRCLATSHVGPTVSVGQRRAREEPPPEHQHFTSINGYQVFSKSIVQKVQLWPFMISILKDTKSNDISTGNLLQFLFKGDHIWRYYMPSQ